MEHSHYYTGTCSEMRVFDRCLSAAEIRARYLQEA